MLKTITELGVLFNNESETEEIDKYLTFPKQEKLKEMILITINLETQDGIAYKYINTTLDKEVDKSLIKKVLYSKGSSRGTNCSPTAEWTGSDKKSDTIDIKIVPFFSKIVNIKEIISKNKNSIREEIEKYSKDKKILLSVKINEKYISDFDFINFKQMLINMKENKSGKIYANLKCSICHKETEVLEEGWCFSFFTLDKPGYAYELNKENSYKMLPICRSCSDDQHIAKQELQKFDYAFYGNKYLLIPKFINLSNKEEIFGLIKDLSEFKINHKNKDNLQNEYEKIFKYICKKNNFVSFYILFYNAPKGIDGSEFKIKKVIEDIFPSQFKELYEDMDNVNEQLKEISGYIYKKKELKHVIVSFEILNYFFNDKDQFIQLTYNLFNKNNLSYGFILSKILSKIRDPKENNFFAVIKGLLLLYFLRMRDMVNIAKGDKMVKIETDFLQNDIVKKIVDFVTSEEHKEFYNTYEKVVSFSLGVLIQKLLMIQWHNLDGNTPFYNKLKSFKLRKDELISLYTEVCNKLREYDEGAFERYIPLKAFVAEQLSKAGDLKLWKMTNDEFNFYLAIGLNLGKKFKSDKEKENVEIETEDE